VPTPKERLSHLLELAAKGAAERAALAGEVAELLLDWPAQYPRAMRANFEALLEKIAREVDHGARRQLAQRFSDVGDASLSLLNELFLAAPDAMKDDIVRRNDAHAIGTVARIDGETLLAAARSRGGFPPALARAAAIPEAVACEIQQDRSCRALAVVARGGGLQRPHFSAIAVLTVVSPYDIEALSLFVPENGAANLLSFWRAKLDATYAGRDAAA
jgi:hypothetical protein